ncbi:MULTISPECIES: aldehyde dehydrogenase family protein [Amycolatopsis]|uniref:Aldehyde dehydrogenase family protein n=4 Tax=Amycolatopsis TaxID=1813 RepID=A0ABW5I568_9PSEU
MSVLDVYNPADGSVAGQAPVCDEARLGEVIEQAHRAWPGFPPEERREALLAAAKAVSAQARALGELITREQGKPLAMAVAEAFAAAAFLRYNAGLALEPEVLREDRRGYAELVRRPLGVVAAVTPWNFPVAVAAAKLAPALRAGNAVVLKPSPYAPLATVRLGEILAAALPPGLCTVVCGDGALGSALATHPLVRQVSFTGSTATGRAVAGQAADGIKPVLLELGGNDAGIVLDDADPAALAEQVFWDSFANNGQACVLIKRLYVPRSRAGEWVEALAAQADSVVVGDGMVRGTQLGPVSTPAQHERIAGLVAAALREGAKAAAGGKPGEGPGLFYPPTILADVTDDMAVAAEEQFGPALPVLVYDTEDEALARANESSFGLGGSVWSADPERAWPLAGRLECGTAWVNAHADFAPDQPFGGLKCSGIGVENGTAGLHEYTAAQVRCRPADQVSPL